MSFSSGIVVEIPIEKLGKPWTAATAKELSNVRLQFGGTSLWWEDLDEGFVLDEYLPSLLGLNPAVLLGRLGGGASTQKKAAAARLNGQHGGRPRKTTAN
jgi:hypothetical protein